MKNPLAVLATGLVLACTLTAQTCTMKAFGKDCGLSLRFSTSVIKDRNGKAVEQCVKLVARGQTRGNNVLLAVSGRGPITPVRLPGGCSALITPVFIFPMGLDDHEKHNLSGCFRKQADLRVWVQAFAICTSGCDLDVDFGSRSFKGVLTSRGLEIRCPKL